VATFTAEPGTEVSGVDFDGSVISFVFGKDGTLEVPDDYQGAIVLLESAGMKREKK
jgi:hypothetical protein